MPTLFENDKTKLETLIGLQALHAYLECSDAVQAGIRELLEVLRTEEDADERAMALATLAEALFPQPHDGKLGMDLEESERLGASHSGETKLAFDELDQEEATFADNLGRLMRDRGLTQQKLAELVGVGQPAISNMLNRQCRPQRKTVARLAEALGVPPAALWPSFSDSSDHVRTG